MVKLDFAVFFFQRVWLPILAMEAASKTTQSGDPIMCNNVPVTLIKRNDKYYGKLHLALDFCKKRCIKLFNNSKDGEDEASDYMCLRYRTGQVITMSLAFFSKCRLTYKTSKQLFWSYCYSMNHLP